MSDFKPQRNVMIAIPTRDPFITVGTMSSIINEMYELGKAGVAMTFFNWSGDPLVSHARNVCFAHFLKTDCTDLFFVDDDVAWTPGAMLRLLNHPVDFVAGIYRHKKDPESYPLNLLDPDLGKLQQDRETGLILVADVPFGFCRLSRACVEKMWEANKDRPFEHKGAPGVECRVLCDITYQPPAEGEALGQYFGEDYAFSRKWREMGGQVWADPSLDLIHHGGKDYKGNVGDWLRRGAQAAPEGHDPEAIRQAFRSVVEALRPTQEAA